MLVSYSEARQPAKFRSGATFMEIEVDQNRPLLDVKTFHIVGIKVTSQDRAAREIDCKLWVDGDGHLRIQKLITVPTRMRRMSRLILLFRGWQTNRHGADGKRLKACQVATTVL